MSTGKWGTWAFVLPANGAAQAIARERGARAVAHLPTVHPNLMQTDDVVAPLETAARDASVTARALLDADVIVADVTDARPEVLFFLGARDLVERRLTIAVHEDDVSDDLKRMFGKRLVRLDADAPAAVARLVTEDSNDSDGIDSELRLRLGSYAVSRKARALKKGADELPANLKGPWRVKREGGDTSATTIDLWWGDVADLTEGDGIHALVNSENTFFEMGRIHDRGLSAVIRYLGARWYDAGRRCDDAVYRALLAKVEERPAPAGTTILTTPGRLREKGLQIIAHVASVQPRTRQDGGPTAGLGYEPVPNLQQCVRNVLTKLDAYFTRRRNIDAPVVLFPLIGTGNAAGDARTISRQVITAIVDHLDQAPDLRLSKILVSAYTSSDLQFCSEVIAWLSERKRIVQ